MQILVELLDATHLKNDQKVSIGVPAYAIICAVT